MIIFPAIDLKGGKCVRLRQGDMARATEFANAPGEQARRFQADGFEYLHAVDLDGAFSGKPENAAAVGDILANVTIPVQLGGGIRDIAAIEAWLASGVTRVIIGTAAVKNPALVREAARKFPGRIAAGIDSRDGRVAIQGWAELSGMTAVELAKRMADAGVAAIIHTDIERDGMMAGLNIAATRALAEAIAVPVIASGGLASIADIRLLAAPENRIIAGAVAGRAIYDGKLDPAEALALARQARAC